MLQSLCKPIAFMALFLWNVCGFADYTILIPSERESLDSDFYKYNPSQPECRNFLQIIDKTLQQHNAPFRASDLSEIDTPDRKTFIKNAKYFVFCNIPTWLPDWKRKLAKIPRNKKVLITFEPPTVLPKMFSTEILTSFGKVCTWNDVLIDKKRFFKFQYPVLQKMTHSVVPFSQKKLLTQISGNKNFSQPNELYSERVKCIKYFEKNNSGDFEFYGVGWDKEGYRNYRGQISDKHAVLKHYRFSICYENTKNIKGYITEKIFDCFQAGVVPIYWGASNVTKYIPAHCFIARKDFSSMKQLVKHLRGMQEERYNEYLQHIRDYLESPQAQQFSKEQVAHSFIKALNFT